MAINNELKALSNTSQSSNTKMLLRLKIVLALVVLGAAFAFFGFYSHLAEAQTGDTSAAAKPSPQIFNRRSLRKLTKPYLDRQHRWLLNGRSFDRNWKRFHPFSEGQRSNLYRTEFAAMSGRRRLRRLDSNGS